MGFYGNITNENRTTFSFDRTYSNRSTMDNSAATDGVYSGRYVLVDYDAGFKQEDYGLVPGAPYWVYNGQLYTGAPITDTLQTFDFFVGENLNAKYPFTELKIGTCVLVPEAQTINVVNGDGPRYIEVGAVVDDPNGQFNQFQGVEITTEVERKFYDYWVTKKEYSFTLVSVDSKTYKSGMYFIANPDLASETKYILDNTAEFDKDKKYYALQHASGKSVPYAASSSGIMNTGNIYVANRKDIEKGDIVYIPTNYAYTIDWEPRFFLAKSFEYNESGAVVGIVWECLGGQDMMSGLMENSTVDQGQAHYLNYCVDRQVYPDARRGYDSTVWQKTIQRVENPDGSISIVDKYVMIAELNSVVPTFDIEADAPTQTPTAPHFDTTSTTVYYKLHMQPQWGLRTKAALPSHTLPLTNTQGEFVVGTTKARELDKIQYPSDQKAVWKKDIYDKYADTLTTSYYDTSDERWVGSENETTKIDSAIYFNKDGFNVEQIAYSADLTDKLQTKRYNQNITESGWKNENKIELTPTGMSGVLYSKHDGSVEKTAQEDVQEFSVMLPALGDTVAHLWDLVYGGRHTNLEIAKTNKRNTDIAWEHARGHLNRNGLRLTGGDSEANKYNAYNENFEINTLAGCINSAHDLMGMIINPDTADNLVTNLKDLNMNQIFYVKPAEALATSEEAKDLLAKAGGKYVMKALTYYYEPLADDEYTYEEVIPNDTEFDKTQYYVEDPVGSGNYRPATNDDNGPFYSYQVEGDVEYNEVEGLIPFDGTTYYYKDINADAVYADNDPLKQDYIGDPKYHEGVQYYKFADGQPKEVSSLSGSYKPGEYFVRRADGSFYLDFNEASTVDAKYYVIDETKIRNIKDNTEGGPFAIQHANYDGIYVPGKYYYKVTNEDGSTSYHLDMTATGIIINGVKKAHYGVKQTGSAEGDEPIYVLQETYQEIAFEAVKQNEEDGVPDSIEYYIKDGGSFVKIDKNVAGWLNEDTVYYTRSTSYVQVTGSVEVDEGKELVLTPYALNTFYKKDYDAGSGEFIGYKHVQPEDITGQSNTEVYYAFGFKSTKSEVYPFTVDEALWKEEECEYAVQVQDEFYTPHIYHYKHSINENGLTYNSYLLDNYLNKTHDEYFEFTVAPEPVNEKFYDPYKFYEKNPVTGEWQLAVGEFDENKEYAEKETFYVVNDETGIFEIGAEWNPNVRIVPPGVILGRRKEEYEFRVLEGFARNLNTLHGLILKMNQVLLPNDKLTRDKRTVQGVINQINDMINQFGKLIPGQLALVDNYGRFHSSDWDTLQDESSQKIKPAANTYAKGIVEDRYPEAATIGDMRKQWITMHTDASAIEPKITIHHNFQPVASSTPVKDLNNEKVYSSLDNTDQISLYVPIVDDMGHVVGSDVTKVTLPYDFKSFSTNGVGANTSQLTTSTAEVVANNTKAAFTIDSHNKWIRMATDAVNRKITIAHEIHSLDEEANGDTDLNAAVNNSFTMQDMAFDAAGHITANKAHKYLLPFGIKHLEVTAAAETDKNDSTSQSGTLTATTHVDTFNISSLNRWIDVHANGKTLSIGHAYASQSSQFDTQSENQEPLFGEVFNIPYNGFDEAGHLFEFGTKTVKIPLPSLTQEGNDIEATVLTAIGLTPSAGALTYKSANVGTLKLTDYLEESDTGFVVAEDTINSAFSKLQAQLKAEVAAREKAISDEAKTRADADAEEKKAREDAIIQEVKDRNQAILDAVNGLDVEDTVDDSKYVSSVSETDGKISVTRADLPHTEAATEEEKTGKYVADVTQDKGVITVHRADFNDILPDVEDTIVDNEYVSGVSQENGKITVTREALPQYALAAVEEEGSYGQLKFTNSKNIDAEGNPVVETISIPGVLDPKTVVQNTTTFTYVEELAEGTAEFTIQWLFAKVAALETRIAELENPTPETPAE